MSLIAFQQYVVKAKHDLNHVREVTKTTIMISKIREYSSLNFSMLSTTYVSKSLTLICNLNSILTKSIQDNSTTYIGKMGKNNLHCMQGRDYAGEIKKCILLV